MVLSRKHFRLDKVDWWLIVLLMLFAAVSLTIITSAMAGQQYETNFAKRQVLYYALGFIIALTLMFISPKTLRKFVWPVYFLVNFALLGLYVLPDSSFTPIINGAKSWYRLGPISLQPSEFMKITLMLALANVIYRHNRFTFNKTLQTDVMLLVKIFITALLPMGLILLQNDLGTTLVLLSIILGTVIVSGVSWRILAPFLIGVAAIGTTLILGIIYRPSWIEKVLGIQTYQLGRINSWLDPGAYSEGDGFHLVESMKAIGSGGLFGKGFKNGEVYIPENHTDFIFSVIGEEFGFIGAIIVLVLFLALFIHLIRLAQHADHPFSALFLIGFLSMLVFHVFQNIGMTIQLVPITGIPLPFISYGGSALWAQMCGIGIALSIFYHHSNQSIKDR
ncbi:FtsW/RodA/SpoVE family cell cycle protein [Macrococcus equipercicus]|uniref:Rod shape-determining protein RodA n=1 Tax=Macrococcus equipercicus TaxID=69967 RepID=A0A9Q9BLT2_9STAP|nr:FtsW/RodA/SpoVE family cell cycle protein [Macrococcus equipercicus]KAA1039230.1 rod shape-determining protein RodA [Macrococcus equipercicus]UTH13520.1 rod shape-determining protein RodA [Macrococcus equipercicus]